MFDTWKERLSTRLHAFSNSSNVTRSVAGAAGVAGVAGGAMDRLRTPPAVALCARPLRAPAYVSIRQRQHTSAYVSIRQHTSAYVSILQRLHLRGAMEAARREVRVN